MATVTHNTTSAHPMLYIQGRMCDCGPVRRGDYSCPPTAVACKVVATSCPDALVAVSRLDAEPDERKVGYLISFVIIFLLLFSCLLCLCSPKGKHSLRYLQKNLSCWNEELYTVALNVELDRMM
jgi:hypothetical protein